MAMTVAEMKIMQTHRKRFRKTLNTIFCCVSQLYNVFIYLFAIAGRKRKKSKTSNYIISCDPTDLSRQADGFVGKLRSNVFGTTFFVYDNGSKSSNQDYYRQDMAVVIYVSVTPIIIIIISSWHAWIVIIVLMCTYCMK